MSWSLRPRCYLAGARRHRCFHIHLHDVLGTDHIIPVADSWSPRRDVWKLRARPETMELARTQGLKWNGTYTCRISTLSPIIMEVENGPKFLNETKFSYRDPFWTSLIIGGRVRSKMWCFVWWLHDAHTMYHPKTNLPAAHIKFEPSIPP